MSGRVNAPWRVGALGVAMCAMLSCSGAKPAPQDDSVQMKDQAVRALDEEREQQRRQMPDRAPQQEAPADEGELAVEMFEVREGKPARAESGLEVRLLSGPPNWAFELDHHGRTARAQTSGTPLYIEGLAFGHLYVLTEFDGVAQVTLRSDAPGEPLSVDQAFELARRERAARLGCDGAREEPASGDNGTVRLRVLDDGGNEQCVIVVGRFTGEVIDL